MIAVSDAAWGFMSVLAVQVVILIGIFVNSHRTRRDVKQVNRAVNHQPDGSPTLVERVGVIEQETRLHRAWEHAAFKALANHVGCALPTPPKEIIHD